MLRVCKKEQLEEKCCAGEQRLSDFLFLQQPTALSWRAQRGVLPIWESCGASEAQDIWFVPAHLADLLNAYAYGSHANDRCAYLATSPAA